MPPLPSGASEGFLKFLAAKGKIEKGQMAATHLRATQDELNGAKVAAIAHSIKDMDRNRYGCPTSLVAFG